MTIIIPILIGIVIMVMFFRSAMTRLDQKLSLAETKLCELEASFCGEHATTTRPWTHLINDDNPWSEYEAFEAWIKAKIHPDTVDYFNNAPSGFSSYLYAALAAEFDQLAPGDNFLTKMARCREIDLNGEW